MLNQIAPVQSRYLRNIHDKIPRQTRGTRWHQHVARRFRQANVAGESGDNYGWNPAAIERVGLNDEDGSLEAGLRTPWFRQLRPPDLPTLNPVHSLPRLPLERLQLSLPEGGIDFIGVAGIHLIEALGNRSRLLVFQESRYSPGVQLAP